MSKQNKPVRMLLAVMAATALALTSGCGGDEATDTKTTSGAPAITNAWARTTAEAAMMGAIYMTITGGQADDRLVSASVSDEIAGETQIHEVVAAGAGATGAMGEDSMGSSEMMMREIDGIDIPAGEGVTLKPGGYHVMLLGLKKQIKEGDEVEVTLNFEQAGAVTVKATARRATG